jgi:hypothetical protein
VIAGAPLTCLLLNETNGPVAHDFTTNANNGDYQLEGVTDSGALSNMAGPAVASNDVAVVFSGAEVTNGSWTSNTLDLVVEPPGLGSSSNYSMECWIFPTLPYASRLINGYFISRGGNGDYDAVGVRGSVGSPIVEGALFFFDNYSGNRICGTTVLPLDAWSYVVMVRSNTSVSLYLDGQLEASGTDSVPPYGSPIALCRHNRVKCLRYPI